MDIREYIGCGFILLFIVMMFSLYDSTINFILFTGIVIMYLVIYHLLVALGIMEVDE